MSNLDIPRNASRLVSSTGAPLGAPPPGNAGPCPVSWAIDPDTQAIALQDTRTGAQIVFDANGTLGFKDANGVLFRTRPDGSLVIQAKEIFLVAQEKADGTPAVNVVELKPTLVEPPADYADTEAVKSAQTP